MLVNAPALFNAAVAALELGVVETLDRAPGSTRAEVAAAADLGDHQTRVLLQALCAAGLVDRDGDGYRLAAAAARLTGDGGHGWTAVLRGWRAIYYPAFARMTESLRSGTNAALDAFPGDEPTLYERIARTPALESTFHDAMAAFSAKSVEPLIASGVFAGARHVLDVGGGDGMTAALLLDRHPDLQVTLFDLPSVAERAAAHATEGRLAAVGGDLFGDEFPGDADVVLFSHVLEVFDETRVRSLIDKAVRALPPGGRVVSYHHHVSDDETRGLYSARLSLYLTTLASGTGMAYPVTDYVRWFEEAGCEHVVTTRDLPYEHAVIVGTLRGGSASTDVPGRIGVA